MIHRVHVLLTAVFLICVLPILAQSNSVSSNPGTVRGSVVDSKTSSPLPGARVQASARGFGSSKSGSTNADGQFVLEGLAPGRYRIRASHEGYSSLSRGMARGMQGSIVLVSAGESVNDVVIRLAPTGSIAGQVTNQQEAPMPNVFVEALKRSYHDGQFSFYGGRSAYTNDKGEFNISDLSPGQYSLKATKPRNWDKNSPPLRIYVPVFYPDTPDPAQAQSIDLRPGEELSGISLSLTQVHAVHVKGRILRSTDNKPAETAYVILSQSGSRGYVVEAQADNSGRFDIAAVPEGSYTLEAQWSPDMDGDRMLTGKAVLSVGDKDVTVSDTLVSPGATVCGKLVANGDGKISVSRSVAFLLPLPSGAAVANAPVETDGSFVFRDVPEGRYRVRLSSVPTGYYLDPSSDSAAAIAVTHGQATTAEVHLQSGAARLQGVVYEDSDKQVPAASATVIVLPDSDATNSDDSHIVTSDRSGRFSIQSLPPGAYSVLALEDADRDSLMDPNRLRQYKNVGQIVHVDSGSTFDLQLTASSDISIQ